MKIALRVRSDELHLRINSHVAETAGKVSPAWFGFTSYPAIVEINPDDEELWFAHSKAVEDGRADAR